MLDLLSPSAQTALVRLIDQRVAEQLASVANSAAESPWLTVDEAAEYLRTTPGAIRKRISRKQLKAHRPEGSRILLRRDDLDALDLGNDRSYDLTTNHKRPGEAGTSRAVTPGG